VVDNKWQDLVSHYISQDFLSVYDKDFKLQTAFTFNLVQLLPNKDITLYYSGEKIKFIDGFIKEVKY
jgi:hypothetical protein